jgi:hypothetical protein
MLRSLLGMLGLLEPMLELRIRRLRESVLDSRKRGVGKFEGEERLDVGRRSTFLSREDGVAAGTISYKVEGERRRIMREPVLGN